MFDKIFDGSISMTALMALVDSVRWYAAQRQLRAIDRIEDPDAVRAYRVRESERVRFLRRSALGYGVTFVALAAVAWWRTR